MNDREMTHHCAVSHHTIYLCDTQKHTRMRRDTFARIAEGIGMTAEELQEMVDANAPLAPLCPAKLAMTYHIITLTPRCRDALSVRVLDHMRETGMGQKKLGATCGLSDTVIRNTAKGLQKRMCRDTFDKLARALRTDTLTLLKECL